MKFGSLVAAATLGSALFGTAVLAADLPARPMPAVAPAFTWTGFYTGLQLGGLSGSFDRSFQFLPPVPFTAPPLGATAIPITRNNDRSSVVGGTRGGYLAQFGMFVIGIDSDSRFYSITQGKRPASQVAAAAFIPLPNLGGDTQTLHSGWDTSVRGRLGLAWDRWMVYGTGGVAFTDIRVTNDFIATGLTPLSTFNKNKTVTGYTAGVGGEWAITDATSIGLEYRHTDFGQQTLSAGAVNINGAVPGGFAAVPATFRTKFTDDSVMFTYNIRLGKIFPQFDWRLF